MEITDILNAIKFPFKEDELDKVTAENIKDYMTKNYVGMEIAHEVPEVINKITGKERASNEVALKRVLKSVDIALDDKVTWKDGMLDKAEEAIKSKIEKLKTDASKDNDKKLTELTTEYDKLKVDYATSNTNIDKLKTELKESEDKHSNYITNQSLNEKVRDAKKTVKFGEEVNELTQKGFWATVNEKYNIELSNEDDSKDGLRITDKSDNKRVNDGKDNLSLTDIYEIEAKEAKILKVNNAPPRDKNRVPGGGGGGEDKNVRKVFSGAEQHAEDLKNQ